MTISRRSILAGLAASPFITKPTLPREESEITADAISPRKLCLYIHGAVILDVQPYGMVLHAPRVTMQGNIAHYYRAGYGTKGDGNEVYPGTPLALLGFAGAKQTPTVDKKTIPYLGPRKLDATGDFCSLITPLPTNLGPLRQIPKDNSCGDFFPGIPGLKELQYLPLVLRVDFDLKSDEFARLVGTDWVDDGSKNPVVIHLRAEPGDLAYIDHDAFLAMSATLGTPIQLASGYSKAAAKYNNQEERTLLEVNQGSTGGGTTVPPCAADMLKTDKRFNEYLFASRPANCVNIVVNNTGTPWP